MWGRARRKGLLQPGEKRAWEDLVAMFPCFKGGYKEGGDSVSTGSHRDEAMGDGCRLLMGRCQRDTRGG